MARIVNLDIELLPEGYYLGMSRDVRGLVVEEKSVAEVIETARHLSRILLEWHEKLPVDEVQIIETLRPVASIAAE